MRFLITFLIFAQVGLLFAGDLDKQVISIASVSTNATVSETETSKIRGYIERCSFSFGISTSTPHITMFSSNVLSGQTTTILASTIRATNFVHIVSTNNSIKMVFDEKIYLQATNGTAGYTAQSIKAEIVYERK